MQLIRGIVHVSLCTVFLSGCKVSVSTSSNPATSPTTAVSTNDKGVNTVTNGIDEKKYKLTTLPSGKKIKLIAVVPLQFAPGGDPPALHLKYRTDLPIKQVSTLRKEANEIWKDFQIEADKGGFTGALVTAADAPKGDAIWQSETYTFAWKKDSLGKWQQQ